jgi:DNA helicase IV
VIVPFPYAGWLTEALAGTGAVVVAAPEARGLEFDTVFVIDPAAIESARARGAHDLYVAVTRATGNLVTVHLAAD